MATVTQNPRQTTAIGEHRIVIRGVGWNGYQSLLKMIGDQRVRVTYDRGDVELMSPHSEHERYAALFAHMIIVLADELDVDFVAGRSTTFNSEVLDKGLEPDECYYFSSASRVHDWSRVDLTVDPPPDLAIEVDITSSSLDKLGIYAALGVPEVWRYDGEALTVLLLGAGNEYQRSEKSLVFPLVPMHELGAFLSDYVTGNDKRWGRSFRKWVRETTVPHQGNA
jgi:Uma2 family endonuclease